MIIDYTYFHGKLNLPQVGNTEGRNQVIQFINQFEPEYLKKVLGYDLWKAFTDGISGSGTPDQRWLDLLEGSTYTHCGKTREWVGFAPLTDGGSYEVDSDNFAELTVDGPGAFDPPAGGFTFTMPPGFEGESVAVYIRGTGRLKTSEFTIVGDQVTLIISALESGMVIFLEKGSRLAIVSGDLLKVSPIANYVYYQYIENDALNTALIGTVVSKTDNNRNVNPVPKLVDAWNRMVEMNRGLAGFLNANKDTYPEWVNLYFPDRWYFDYWYNYEYYQNDLYERINSLDL